MDLSHGGWGFLLFPGLDHEELRLKARGLEAAQGLGAVVLMHDGVGHDQDLGARFDAPVQDLRTEA